LCVNPARLAQSPEPVSRCATLQPGAHLAPHLLCELRQLRARPITGRIRATSLIAGSWRGRATIAAEARAVCNAICLAAGTRVRTLPLKHHDLRAV